MSLFEVCCGSGLIIPAALAEGFVLVRVLGDPVLILPSSDGGNKPLTESANSEILLLPPDTPITTPTTTPKAKPASPPVANVPNTARLAAAVIAA
ncbi:hypothetical protein [Snodgrassella sp. B3837]|uniref:hypothetical protein n=1 Tax=Snodgrassella sp. B3837 TaxID=2818040 RepID=UPI00226A9E1E|nr:hypothetical protein [Snodgrassella sp. B3837]MCX8753728.1 hypothetical protein [Snodgrassella sp. B3837]